MAHSDCFAERERYGSVADDFRLYDSKRRLGDCIADCKHVKALCSGRMRRHQLYAGTGRADGLDITVRVAAYTLAVFYNP